MANHSHDHHGHDHDHDHAGHYHPEPTQGPIHFSDPAQESLSQALQSGFNVLRVIMVVLVVAYFLSGWFQVNTGEQGLVARFGVLRVNTDQGSPFSGKPVFGPGVHPSLPDPFDQKIRIPGTTQKVEIDSFCFARDPKNAGNQLSPAEVPQLDKLTPGVHNTMMSGDRNLSFGLWTVEYRIDNGEDFVRNVGESKAAAERLVKRMAEAAITRVVAGIEGVNVTRFNISQNSDDFTTLVRARLQQDLTRLGTGIVIDKMIADTVFPGLVNQAFSAAQNAANQSEQSKNDAMKERAQTLGKTAGTPAKVEPLLAAIEAYGAAQSANAAEEKLAELRAEIDRKLDDADGEVAARLRQAETNANNMRETLRREYEEFVNYLAAYKRFPQLTTTRLWVRMREAILTSRDNEIFFVPNTDEVRIQTNRDPQRVLEEDERRYRERFNPQ
ncbi:MAG: SPFH domain-containing protein [Phycisphaerae bacterium]